MLNNAHSVISGGLTSQSDRWEKILNPFDGSLVGSYQLADPSDVEMALGELSVGFGHLSELSLNKRAEILSTVADKLETQIELFARLICLEVGKPIKQARIEVKKTIDILRLTAEEAIRLAGSVIPLHRQDSNCRRLSFTRFDPMGTVLVISPYNFPLGTLCHKVAPAIAAGNPVLVKPSPRAPLTAFNFAGLFLEAGLPKQAISMLHLSDDLTQRLAADPRIRFVNFTGSAEVGWRLRSMLSAGTRCILELGGTSPTIIHNDCDLDAALTMCLRGGYSFSGQSCISLQRLYVHSDIFSQFATRFTELVDGLAIGNPQEEDTDIGPLITQQACQRVDRLVRDAISANAKPLTGARMLPNNCYAPTLLSVSDNSSTIMQTEIFGPVACLHSYSDVQQAVDLANSSPFGLSAGVFTRDINLALDFGRRLNFASVLINDSSSFRADEMPISGHNQSGLGTEGPSYAMREMSIQKVITINAKNPIV